MKIIDIHTHVGNFNVLDIKQNINEQYLELLKTMDKWGINKSIVTALDPMSWQSWNQYEFGGNESIIEGMSKYPDRIKGYYIPNYFGNPGQSTKSIVKIIKKYNFVGIKIHPVPGGFPANARQLIPTFNAADELGIPILYHSGHIPTATPAEIFDMAKKYPDVNIIAGHAGKSELWFDMLAVARYANNLYIETSGQLNQVFLNKFIEEIGDKRVLYGSDWLGLEGKLPWAILRINELNIDENAKNNIFYKNAEKLFKLV